MPNHHQATPDEWAQQSDWAADRRSSASSCIVELRGRIEAIEAAQHAHVNYAPAKPEHQDKLGRLIEQDRSDAQQLTLVERVADAIGAADDEGLTNMTWSNHSRAAIRVVAEWLRAGALSDWGLAAADLLDNEASR